jgi:hypothetical protein
MSRIAVAPRLTFKPNGLDFWPFRGGPGLAKWIAVLVCAQFSAGCMVPQNVDAIQTEPHPPPQFLVGVGEFPDYLLAPQLQLYRQGAADAAQTPLPCHCVVEIPPLSISEPDPTIDLTARWFVDYDLSVARSTSPVRAEALPGTFNDATATRRQIGKFDFDADALQILSSGPHVLEVVVGETAGFDDSPATGEPNRTPKAGFTFAVYRFFINVKVEQDPTRPSCPSVPPSVRVCQ